MTPQVTFRGISPSPSVVDRVFRNARKLGVIAPQLAGCHVVIEVAGRGSRRSTAYRVAVHLRGGAEASRRSARYSTHDNIYVALREAFEASRRQLESRGGRRHVQAAPISVIH